MPRSSAVLLLCACLLVPGVSSSAQDGPKLTAKEALKPFNHVIGQWKGTGRPKGTLKEMQKGFWMEIQDWVWRFKGEDAWIEVTIDKGKYFTKGELRYLPAKGEYQFTLQTTDNKTVVFTGTYEDKWLTLEREDKDRKETQKLMLRLLHPNRFLFLYDVRPDGKTLFTHVYEVGVTKLGEEFASGDGQPECIVSGGLGTIKVNYQGKTYFVCCTGCRDEFLSDPQKYIAAAEKKKK
jgi:hypothetical protein